MTRTRFVLAGLFVSWLLALSPAPADACSCMGGKSPCETIWSAAAVFDDGTPFDGGSFIQQERLVRLRDVRKWIGEPADVVITGSGGGDCGYDFKPGVRYVIAAYNRRFDNRLGTGICSETRPVAEASALLAYLESLSRPSPGARVFGSVVVRRSQFEQARTSEGVAGARVSLVGPTTHSTATGTDGQYSIDRLTPGQYLVSVELPHDRSELAPIRTVTVDLPNAHACASPHLSTAVNGAIEGLVVDAQGRPAAGVSMALRRAEAPDPARPAYAYGTTNESGQFVFDQLPAGRYTVGVNLHFGASPESPYAVAYGRTTTGALAVELGVGDRQILEPIVTRRLETVRVTGIARLADGRPAGAASVSTGGIGEYFNRAYRSAGKTEADGRFSLELLRGARYTISVRSGSGDEGQIEITADDAPLSVTLVPRRR